MSVSDRTALEAAAFFELGGRPVSAVAFGSGHINDTFALTVEKPASDAFVRFVLQRINPHVFPDPLAVMDNIVRVTRHLRGKYAILPDVERRVLTVIPTKDAKPCRFDEWVQFHSCAQRKSWSEARNHDGESRQFILPDPSYAFCNKPFI